MAYKIYNAVERGSTEVPIDLIMRNGTLDVSEDVIGNGYFNFSLKKTKLVLVAGNFVGLIPLNKSVAISVEPKVGRSKWLQIVERSESALRELHYLRAYSQTDTLSTSILEFLIRALIYQLNEIDLHGLYARYIPHKERTSFPRGRILFDDSIRDAWSKGYIRAVVSEHYLFSKDIPHNRLLKYAIYLAAQYLPNFRNVTMEVYRRMGEIDNLFSAIPLDPRLNYLTQVIEDIERDAIPDVRNYYVGILKTALLIVMHTGITIGQLGSTETLSFVVNMESTFEKYCQTILKQNANMLGNEVQVLNQLEGKIPLFTGAISDDRYAEPDIVIRDSNKNLLTIEVKYKDSPDRNDLNQAVTYAVAYNTPLTVILCFDSKNESGWKFVGNIGNQIQIWVYKLGIEAESLDTVEAQLIAAIRDMIAGKVKSPPSN